MCFPAVHLLRVSLKQHVSNSVTVSVNVVIQLNDRSVHPVHEWPLQDVSTSGAGAAN